MFASIGIGIAVYLGVGALHIPYVAHIAKVENERLTAEEWTVLVCCYPIIWAVYAFDEIKARL